MAKLFITEKNFRAEKHFRRPLVAPEVGQQGILFQLAMLAGLSALVYAWCFVKPAILYKWYAHTEANFYSIFKFGSLVHIELILAFLLLGVVYMVAYWLSRQAQGRAAWAIVLGGALLFGLILLNLYPYDAADIFDAILRGRITAVYGGNPYLQTPNQFPGDPFYPYVAWKGEQAEYGPIYEHLTAWASRLAGNGIVANVLAYKFIPGLFLLGSIALVALILKKVAPEHALSGTLLFAWNPVVLYETWGNGHNDMVMAFFILAAAWAMTNRRFTLAVLALMAGTLVKFVPVLLIPVALVLALRELPSWERRLSFLARTALLGAALTALLYARFWAGPQVLTVLQRYHLYTSSIPASLYYLLKPRYGDNKAASLVGFGAFGLTILFALWQAWQARRKYSWDSFMQASFNILAFYLLVTCLWFQQWYTLWLLGLVPLIISRPARLLGILFGFAALSKQFGIGGALFTPRPRLHEPWLEIWLTLGVLGIPWLIALYNLWQTRRFKAHVGD